jgi:1-acyl-sn-glycerol-3-phosphate acyltransferase
MFYSFIRVVARIVVAIINGNSHYLNKEKLPEGNYIVVGPHRAWFDMIYFALAASPKRFSFMAKKELFKNLFSAISWITQMLFPSIVNTRDPLQSKHPSNGYVSEISR